MLNLQLYWRPTGRDFGAPKNMGGLCFQVLGSLGVLGVLGVFVFKTPLNQLPLASSQVGSFLLTLTTVKTHILRFLEN